uniref:Helix-turn-helix domain-containing protein n=1 Tax=Phenylobacterium glaciei TaxID=2803784 RepID=A0A974P5Y1_9CAUL|nr:helix-turn-helix domain-containing protein [Phenylobacterium glaciei]
MSERTFSRVFQKEIGTTPAAFVEIARVDRAKALLETSDWPLARVGSGQASAAWTACTAPSRSGWGSRPANTASGSAGWRPSALRSRSSWPGLSATHDLRGSASVRGFCRAACREAEIMGPDKPGMTIVGVFGRVAA